jgi:hypothetical protein
MKRFHTIRKHEASRRFGKQSHDCLNLHDSHCAATPTTSTLRCAGGINGRFARRSIAHESRVATRPQVKPNSRFEYQYAKFQKKTAREKRCWPHHGFATSLEVGPGATVGTLEIRYPRVQLPGQDRRRDMQNHMPLRVICLGVNRMPQASSGAATCPAPSAPATRPETALGPPRVPWRPNGRRAIKVIDIP